MADRLSVCYVCGTGLPSREARRAHYATEHPKHRVTWRGRNPLVIDPDGTERVIDKAAEARMRRAAVTAAKKSRRIEELTGPGSAAGPGLTGTPPGSTVREADPVDPAPSAPRSVRVSQPTVRPTESALQTGTREAVRDALDVTLLADIIRDFSIALSEADGAGEAGHLSHIQARQVASLAYDATVDFVVDRFGGNVTRFKLALACLVILAAKGRVHVLAISRNIRAAGDSGDYEPVEAVEATDWPGPTLVDSSPPLDDAAPAEPEPDPEADALAAIADPIAELAARQAAFSRSRSG